MGKYIVRRLLQMIPVILGTTFLIFTLTFAIPGNPVAGSLRRAALPPELRRSLQRAVQPRQAPGRPVRALSRQRSAGRPRDQLLRQQRRARARHPLADHHQARHDGDHHRDRHWHLGGHPRRHSTGKVRGQPGDGKHAAAHLHPGVRHRQPRPAHLRGPAGLVPGYGDSTAPSTS